MTEEIIKTQVDDLLDLLKHTSKIPLSEAAKKLNVAIDVVQSWVDFLVEENIIGIEYSFTTPYIYLNKPIESKKSKDKNIPEEQQTIEYFKKEFWDRAKGNNIPEEKIETLWKNHILQALELKKKYFLFEAQRRKIKDIPVAWEEYENKILFA